LALRKSVTTWEDEKGGGYEEAQNAYLHHV